MNNRKPFIASLIRGGIIGGALYISETEAVFRTSKLTVPPNIRRLSIPARDIAEITLVPRLLFSVLTFKTRADTHRFLVFSKSRLKSALSEFPHA